MERKGCFTAKIRFTENEGSSSDNKAPIELLGGPNQKQLLERAYDVYPVTMMVEGAYFPNIEGYGEKTALYFNGDDLHKSVQSWNGRPVSLNHPCGDTTCNTPEILNEQWLGFIFNTEYDSSEKKLRSELWLDASRGNEISSKVQRMQEIDVSIGAYGDIVKEEGLSNGVPYTDRMVNISGDHLAILPDTQGACGWSDGCGIRAQTFIGCEMKEQNMDPLTVDMVRSSARKPSYNGIETTSWGNVSKSLGSYVRGYYKSYGNDSPKRDVSIEKLPSAVKSWIASKTLLGDVSADNERELIFFPVVNPITNKLNAGALRAVLSGRGSQANISSSSLDSARNKARVLLEEHFGGSDKKENAEEKIEGKMVDNEKKFVFENWMSDAPEEVRVSVQSAMEEYKTLYNENINRIITCDDAVILEEDFTCKKGFSAPMGLVRKIASLVDKYTELKGENETLKESHKEEVVVTASKNVNYGVRAMSEGKESLDYAPFKDIDWKN